MRAYIVKVAAKQGPRARPAAEVFVVTAETADKACAIAIADARPAFDGKPASVESVRCVAPLMAYRVRA